MNVCVFAGRLAQNPELNHLNSGQAVARFSLAMNRVYKEKKFTDFLDFQAFGRTAEFLTEHFHKGDACMVQASARVDKWRNAEGENRRKIVFNVDKVNFVPSNFINREGQEEPAMAVADTEQGTDF